MTGKDLDGTTAGIAYVRTVCDVERGVSVSSRSFGTTISALIMAHELGHNFGARTRRRAADTACAATGGGFIMASSVSGYATFSQCSIDTMQPVLAAASCVTPARIRRRHGGRRCRVGIGRGRPAVHAAVHRALRAATRPRTTSVLTVTLPDNRRVHHRFGGQLARQLYDRGRRRHLRARIDGRRCHARRCSVIARSTSAANFSVQAQRHRGQRPHDLEQQPPVAA